MGSHSHPEVTMHTHPLSEYMRCIETGDWIGVAHLMLSSAEKLVKVGADFLISPDNTIHQSYNYVVKQSPLPWLNIAEEVISAALTRHFKKIGILGTKYLMEGPVYSDKLKEKHLESLIPLLEQRERINNIILNELVYGIIKKNSKEYFLSVISDLKSKGCDSVVLGCTEIPLIVFPEESTLPTLDSTRILARAALNHAIKN